MQQTWAIVLGRVICFWGLQPHFGTWAMIQQTSPSILPVFAAMALGGLLFLLISVFAFIPLVRWHKRRMRRIAVNAGRVVKFQTIGPSVETIWGCGGLIYCLIFIAIGVAVSFGVTFPIQLEESFEAQLTAFVIVFGGILLGIFTPGALIYAIYWDIREQRKGLEEALSAEAPGRVPVVTDASITCPKCGALLTGDEHICPSCRTPLTPTKPA